MGKVLSEMSMSLDGYVTGPDVSPEAPMGRGGELLHDWMFAGRSGCRPGSRGKVDAGVASAWSCKTRREERPEWKREYPRASGCVASSTRS